MIRSLQLSDVLPAGQFVGARTRLESELLAAKRSRRVRLGNHLTYLFENRATVLWQVQEMCRVEQINQPAAIQAELDTYNPLLPGASELSATVLLEYEDADVRAVAVRQLVGLHQHLWMQFGGPAPSQAAPPRRTENLASVARFFLDDAQFNQERVSSVQFARAPLSPTQRTALANLNEPVFLYCSHPAYLAETALSSAVRAALIDDLNDAAS